MARDFQQLLEGGALVRLDEDRANWFQDASREFRPRPRPIGTSRRRWMGRRGAFPGAFSMLFSTCSGIGNLYNAAMELSERQRKYLRGLGHVLNPVILVGQHGISPAVIAETARALADHELIKVKFRGADRAARDSGFEQLASATHSMLLQRIGHTALYYKRREDRPGIVIPDA